MGNLYVVMGKSATGKDTIYRKLIQKKELELRPVVPYTTRPIREGEQNGENYFFVTADRMEELERQGRVIERRSYETVHGIWHYFTADDGQIDLSRGNYLMIGTLEAYEKIRAYYGKEAVIPLYIQVEDGLRLSRALERERQQSEPRYAEMCRRFLADQKDFSEEELERLAIRKRYENTDLEDCLRMILGDLRMD